MTAARKKSATKAQAKPPLALVDDTTAMVGDPALAALSNSTEHIVGAVTRAIVEHRLLPGAKLVEQKLGDRFGVSRTIVRQALFRLSQLKLVRLEPARGAFVAEPSIKEAREVFAVRRMVEGQMVRRLIAQLKASDIKLLKAHLKDEREAVARIDVATRTKLLFDFHVRMAEVVGNQVLVELMQEHADILAAIEARDADEAARLIDSHLLTVEHQLTERRRVPSLRLEDALGFD